MAYKRLFDDNGQPVSEQTNSGSNSGITPRYKRLFDDSGQPVISTKTPSPKPPEIVQTVKQPAVPKAQPPVEPIKPFNPAFSDMKIDASTRAPATPKIVSPEVAKTAAPGQVLKDTGKIFSDATEMIKNEAPVKGKEVVAGIVSSLKSNIYGAEWLAKSKYTNAILDNIPTTNPLSPLSLLKGVKKDNLISNKVRETAQVFVDKSTGQLENWEKALLPEEMDFWDTLAYGAGSAAYFFVPGMATSRGLSGLGKVSPKVANLVGSSISTFLESSMEAGSVYDEVKKEIGDESLADDAATRTFVANSMLIGITNYFGAFSDNIANNLKRALVSAPIEGFQEFWQTVISNVNTGKVGGNLIEQSGMWQGTGISALIGTILGVPMGYLGQAEGIDRSVMKRAIEERFGGNEPPTITPPPTGGQVDDEARDKANTVPTSNLELQQALEARLIADNQSQQVGEVILAPTEESPASITIVPFSDGTFGVNFNVDISNASFTSDALGTTYKTRELALKDVTQSILQWAKEQEAATPEDIAKLSAIVSNVQALAAQKEVKPLVSEKQKVEAEVKQTKILYRGGGEGSMPKGKTAQDIIDYEVRELGNFDVVVENGVDLTKIKSENLTWLTTTKKAAAEYGEVEPVSLEKYRIIARDKQGGVLVEKLSEQKQSAPKRVLKTQEQKVKEAVKEKPKTIQEIAKETKILEPNVRRILGVGAKEGTFTRVEKGVYILSKDGVDTAFIHTGDAVETLPKLVKEGLKVDMVYLDIPYDTNAVKGGNRGIEYSTITPAEFKTVVDAVIESLRSKDAPVIYMFSQAKSGLKQMEKYNQVLLDAGLKPIARGELQKLFKDGRPVTNVRGVVAKPEGIIVLNQSGNDLKLKDSNFQFRLVRPTGYQTEKPAAMLKKLIEMTTKEGEVVLDPFAGSGVTGAEAVKLKRKAVLIEKNPTSAIAYTHPRVAEAQGVELNATEKFIVESLKDREKEIKKLQKRVEEMKKAGDSERQQIYQNMIKDYERIDARDFAESVRENPNYYINSNVDPFLLYKNIEVNKPSATKPRFAKPRVEKVAAEPRFAKANNDYLFEVARKFATAEQFVAHYRGSATQYNAYTPRLRKFGTTEQSARISELGIDPNLEVTIYRGIDDVENRIKNPTIKDGDFVTTDYDSANSYTGGTVISKTVKAKDLIADFADEFNVNDPFYTGAEFIYSKSSNKLVKLTDKELSDLWSEAQSAGLPIEVLKEQERYIQKHGKVPPNADIKGFQKSQFYNKYGTTERQQASNYYEYISQLLEKSGGKKIELPALASTDKNISISGDKIINGKSNSRSVSASEFINRLARANPDFAANPVLVSEGNQFIFKSGKSITKINKELFGIIGELPDGITIKLEPNKTNLKGEVDFSEVKYKIVDQLTTKILSKLGDRETVSKQFISDLTNSGDVKQVEKDIIRDVLASEGDNVDVKVFKEKVRAQLIPLTVNDSDVYAPNEKTWQDQETMISEGRFTPKYESISLFENERGDVESYQERIYESPIETSAGEIHFNYHTKNYFGHTRIENMARGVYESADTVGGESSVRRVIEVQSDLYQKGRLENEIAPYETLRKNLTAKEKEFITYIANKDTTNSQAFFAAIPNELFSHDKLRVGLSDAELFDYAIKGFPEPSAMKLQQYNDPTAHFRMIREEVKQAALDGKKFLQFPTGETAMKIEGLGVSENLWLHSEMDADGNDNHSTGIDLTVETMKEGEQIQREDDATPWIITEVLDGGKFKAVPKDFWDDETKHATSFSDKLTDFRDSNSFGAEEAFDISGKIDTNNPIYKFYEKEVGRYLKNRYNATRITDNLGVDWWQVNVTPQMAIDPVEAFLTQRPREFTFNITLDEARAKIKDILGIEPDIYMTKRFPHPGAIGAQIDDWILLLEKGGKISEFALTHESWHLVKKINPNQKENDYYDQFVIDNYKERIDELRPKYEGYTDKQLAEEVQADEWARFRRTGKTLIEKLKVWFDKLKQQIEAVFYRRGELLDYFQTIKENAPKNWELFQKGGEVKFEGELWNGTKKSVTQETKSFNNVKVFPNDQHDVIAELAKTDPDAAKIGKLNFYEKADRFLRNYYGNVGYDAIQYNNEHLPQKGKEYMELQTGRFFAENKVTAENYAMQNRERKYIEPITSKPRFLKISDENDNKTNTGRDIKAIQVPELVELTKELTGDVPKLNKLMRLKRGVFKAQGSNASIELNTNIFKDPVQVGKTLAHEIGHLTDWLPRFGGHRTSMLQKLYVVKNTIKTEMGEVQVKNQQLKDELWALSKVWRPLEKAERLINSVTGQVETVITEMTEEEAGEKYLNYRKSGNELYADAMSVLFNDPARLKREAPLFYNQFFATLDQKPEASEAYWELQNMLHGAPEELFKAREARILGGFQKGVDIQAEFEAKKEAADRRLWERMRQQLDNRYYPILKKVKEAEARGEVIDERDNPKYLLQDLAWSNNDNYLMIEKIDQEVTKPVKEAGMTDEDIGLYLLLNRIQTSRKDIANPYGFDLNTAKDQMNFLRERVGDDNFQLLKDSVAKFHDIVWGSVEKAVEVGSYGREIFEKTIKPNRGTYATFSVVDYLQDYVPAGVKKQMGTLKEVANPYYQTILKTAALNKLNIQQEAKNGVIKFLQTQFPADIKPTPEIRAGRMSIFKNTRGMGQLQVLVDGKLKSYDVDPYIADSFEFDDPDSLNVLVKSLSWINQKFKALVTTYNLGFALAFNPIRDFRRNYKNIPNATVYKLLKAYATSVGSAARFAKGKLDPITRELVENRAMGAPMGDYNYDPREGEMERILEKFGVKTNNTKETRLFVLKPLIKLLSGMRFVANTFEVVSKIAGAKVRMAGGETGKRLYYNVRNYTGTPNWKVKGVHTNTTNEIFIFSNIMKEGLKSDLIIATSPKTRSGYWWKTVKIDLLPKILMFAAAAGLLGDKLKDLFEKMTEYDKTNYITIPLGETNGKVVYMRVPHDETGRLFSASLWKMMNFAKDHNAQSLADIFALGAGQLPNLSPVITTGAVWGQYLSGRNPYDSFRGRQILDDTTFQAGGMAGFKKMVQWTANAMGLSQFTTYQTAKDTTLETIFQVMPLVNRLFKITDYGVSEGDRKVQNEIKTERARELIKEKDAINNAVKANPDASQFELIDNVMKQVLGHDPENAEEFDRQKNIMNKLRRALLIGHYDTRFDNIVYAQSNKEKVALLKKYQTEMTPEQYDELLMSLQTERVISKEVLLLLSE